MKTTLIQKRRFMAGSSGSMSSAVTLTGSRAMPHFGHVPGPIWRISGCIGQVYSTPVCTGTGIGDTDTPGGRMHLSRN